MPEQSSAKESCLFYLSAQRGAVGMIFKNNLPPVHPFGFLKEILDDPKFPRLSSPGLSGFRP
jgi:hypothetical protein